MGIDDEPEAMEEDEPFELVGKILSTGGGMKPADEENARHSGRTVGTCADTVRLS